MASGTKLSGSDKQVLRDAGFGSMVLGGPRRATSPFLQGG